MDAKAAAAGIAAGLSSPISVVGFACASSELHSPRSSTSQSSTGRDQARSSVSLLSLLLTTSHSSAAARARTGSAAEDTYDDEDAFDEDDEDGDESEEGSYPERHQADDGHPLARAHGSADHLQQRAANAEPLRRSTTAPMEVPTSIWLREPLAQHELKRMHYERCVRRAQLEALQQQQALAYQQQMRDALHHQQQQMAALPH